MRSGIGDNVTSRSLLHINILVLMRMRIAVLKRWSHGLFSWISVAFNTKYNWIASASMNSKVIVYDFGTCRIRHELQHGGGVIRLVWHPNNIVLITGCLDGCVYLWDGRTGELLKQLNGHTVVIYTGFHE